MYRKSLGKSARQRPGQMPLPGERNFIETIIVARSFCAGFWELRPPVSVEVLERISPQL
jgi:hypothetical protein